MDQPNGMPPIMPTTSMGVPSTSSDPMSQSIEAMAVRFTEHARVVDESKRKLTAWVTMMERANVTLDQMAQHATKEQRTQLEHLGVTKVSAAALREYSTAMNLSFEQIKKMPLKDVVRNFSGLTSSMIQLMNPVMELGTAAALAAAGVQYVVDSMAQLNRNARGFSVQSGAMFTAGGFAPSQASKEALLLGEEKMNKLGMSDNGDREKFFTAISAMFPKGGLNPDALAKRGAEIGPAALRFGTATGTGPDKALEMLSGAARFNLDISRFGQGLRNAANDMKDMPLGEASASIYELWNSTKRLGVGFEQAGRTAKSFEGDLKSGLLTTQDVAKMMTGPKQSSVQEVAKFMALARSAGVQGLPTGGSVVNQVGKFADMAQNGSISVDAVFRQMFAHFSKQFGGGTGGQMMARDMLKSQGIIPQNLIDEIMGESFSSVRHAKKLGKAPGEGKYASMFAEMAPNLEELDTKSRSLAGKFGKLVSASDVLIKRFENLSGTMPTGLSENSPTPYIPTADLYHPL